MNEQWIYPGNPAPRSSGEIGWPAGWHSPTSEHAPQAPAAAKTPTVVIGDKGPEIVFKPQKGDGEAEE